MLDGYHWPDIGVQRITPKTCVSAQAEPLSAVERDGVWLASDVLRGPYSNLLTERIASLQVVRLQIGLLLSSEGFDEATHV